MGKMFLEIAKELGIKVRWGNDWDMDGDLNDQKFIDSPHFELVG
jgi:peptidoglycan LD-endopeptidase CwlK